MLQNTEKYENYDANSTSVLGPNVAESPKSTKITTKTRLQFLGRMLQRQKRQKSTSFIVKTPFKSIAEHRKVVELQRKLNIEEVEEPKKYENLQTKPVLDPFKSTAEHRKVRQLPRKMNIEEVEEPEATKIYRQNPFTPAAAKPKLRKFTDETNMQARNHENSDEFRPAPVRHQFPPNKGLENDGTLEIGIWGIWKMISVFTRSSCQHNVARKWKHSKCVSLWERVYFFETCYLHRVSFSKGR